MVGVYRMEQKFKIAAEATRLIFHLVQYLKLHVFRAQ